MYVPHLCVQHTWHIFSQIIVICFNVKTGRSAFLVTAVAAFPLTFRGGELDTPASIGDVARCCSIGTIGSGDPGETGPPGDLGAVGSVAI